MRWLMLMVLGSAGCFTELGIGANRTFAPWDEGDAGWGAMVSVSQGSEAPDPPDEEPRKVHAFWGVTTDFITGSQEGLISLGFVVGSDMQLANGGGLSFRIAPSIAPDMIFATGGKAGAWGVPAFVGKSWAIGRGGVVSLGTTLAWFRGGKPGDTLFVVGPMVRIHGRQGLREAWRAVPRGM